MKNDCLSSFKERARSGAASSDDIFSQRRWQSLTLVRVSVNEDRPEREVERSGTDPASMVARLWSRYGQVFRYLVVGGLNTVFGYGTFAVLNYFLTGHVPYAYMAASALSSVVSISFAFVGYKFFVFKTKGNFLREYLRTYAVYGSSMLVGLALLPALVFALGFVIHRANVVPYVAQAITMVIVVFGSFFGHKKFSFRP